jgi:hypothetical protein
MKCVKCGKEKVRDGLEICFECCDKIRNKKENFERTKEMNRKSLLSRREGNRSSLRTKSIKEKWETQDRVRTYISQENKSKEMM